METARRFIDLVDKNNKALLLEKNTLDEIILELQKKMLERNVDAINFYLYSRKERAKEIINNTYSLGHASIATEIILNCLEANGYVEIWRRELNEFYKKSF